MYSPIGEAKNVFDPADEPRPWPITGMCPPLKVEPVTRGLPGASRGDLCRCPRLVPHDLAVPNPIVRLAWPLPVANGGEKSRPVVIDHKDVIAGSHRRLHLVP